MDTILDTYREDEKITLCPHNSPGPHSTTTPTTDSDSDSDSTLLTTLSISLIHAYNNPSHPSSVSAFSQVLPSCSCHLSSLPYPVPFTEFLQILIQKTAESPRNTTVLNSSANVVGNQTAVVFSYVKILGNPDGMAREAMQVFKWRKVGRQWFCYEQTALRSAEGIRDLQLLRTSQGYLDGTGRSHYDS